MDAFGNSDSTTYVDINTFPFISSITDALNRVVEFEYTGTGRWRKLSRIRYYNYKDNSPDWLEVNYSYNATAQLRKVTYPNGDSVVYGYYNYALKPNASDSVSFSDSTRVLSSVKTTRGGEVKYRYKLFQEQREDRIDSVCIDADTIGSYIICNQWTQFARYQYVNHWSIYKRYAKSNSTGTNDSTTIQHAPG